MAWNLVKHKESLTFTSISAF